MALSVTGSFVMQGVGQRALIKTKLAKKATSRPGKLGIVKLSKPQGGAMDISRSGRIRKKSSKLADFESPDEIDAVNQVKKQPRVVSPRG